MHDKGGKRLADGELARKGRALQSIKEILGLDDQAYQAFLDGMTEVERATYDAEVQQYMELCTIMSGEHLQWSSQLLLKAPEATNGTDQSSFIGPLGAFLLGAIKDGKSLAQHLRYAAYQISKLADTKQRFLVELYNQLRPDEREKFGDLLGACTSALSILPNIKLSETLERLDLCWKFRYEDMAELLGPVPGIVAEPKSMYLRVTKNSNRAIRHILAGSEVSKDSLAARLMLASLVNRYHWEMLEYERFEDTAVPSLLRLIRGLRAAGWRHIPAELGQEAFKELLMSQFSNHSFAEEQEWRPLKAPHLERIYAQAEWILGWDRIDFVTHDASDSELLNMCALNLAWSYCTREKHDMRVPNVKDYDLVNLREIESGEQVPLTRIKYQQQQLNTMLRSQQHCELDPELVEFHTASNRDLRTQRMQFIRSNFKDVSLAQWRTLSIRVWEIIFPQFCLF